MPPLPPSATGATSLRLAQVRGVGAAFLRRRPLIALPVALANAVLVALSGAPAAQRAGVGGLVGGTFLLFCAEALRFRRDDVEERWLALSLGLTLVLLGAGCALSGGIASPLAPLLLVPLVVALAAFGRSRPATLVLAIGGAVAVGLAALPTGFPFPPLPARPARLMLLASFAGAAALAYVGVGGLVDAHANAANVLGRMRAATLEEAASRMRATEQVGAKVAHELKNPLAAIRALVQLVARGDLDARTQKRLDVALTEIDRMDAIVRDYLAFARPLADLAPERVDALALVRDVVAVLEARGEQAGVVLETRGDPAPVVADPRRLREALLNLTANALAATPTGGTVTIRVARGAGGVVICIEDSGPGLPRELRDGQALPFVTTTEGGTGLGLVLARGAIRQHGGELSFSDRKPMGTIATVTIPDAPSGAPRPASSAPASSTASDRA